MEKISTPTVFFRSKLKLQINKTFKFIAYYDIIQIECEEECLAINLNSNRVLYTYDSLTYFQNNLPSVFLRIHRSYIINLMHISEYSTKKNRILVTMSNGATLFVSRNLKQIFLQHLSSLKDCICPTEHCLMCKLFDAKELVFNMTKENYPSV